MDLLNAAAKTQFTKAMQDLEDTFAKHSVDIKSLDIIDAFSSVSKNSFETISDIKCLVVPRTDVDESDVLNLSDIGTYIHQQLTVYVFKREAISKGIYNDSNELFIKPGTSLLVYRGADYKIEQFETEGNMGSSAGELIKLRVTKQMDNY